jgi:hypothetical protein
MGGAESDPPWHTAHGEGVLGDKTLSLAAL